LGVRCSATGKRVFSYRYRSQDGALREIILGDVGPLTLARARDAALKKRLERQEGKDTAREARAAGRADPPDADPASAQGEKPVIQRM
jgi:Arm DNA-binding domain